MTAYTFKRWTGSQDRVEAEKVVFTAGGGVAFWCGTTLVLAVRPGDWNDVREEV